MADDELATVVGVQQTIAAYAREVDQRLTDGVAALFADDARVEVMGEVHVGKEAVWNWIESLKQNQAGIHLTTNTLVKAEGPGLASAVSDVAFIRRVDSGWQFIVAGQYIDTLRREADGWRFTSRRIVLS